MTLRWALFAALLFASSNHSASAAEPLASFGNRLLSVSIGCGQNCLWQFTQKSSGISHRFTAPDLLVDGKRFSAAVREARALQTPLHLPNGVTQYSYAGPFKADNHLTLRMLFELNEATPVIRFRYEVASDTLRELSKLSGRDDLTYLETSFASFNTVQEVTLSGFAGLTHTYELAANSMEQTNFENGSSAMGPILAGSNRQNSFLIAYEHGSTVPDRFLEFRLHTGRQVSLSAVKANYLSGQKISLDRPFRSVWFETAAVDGDLDQLAHTYRQFVLHHLARNNESRKPYIFYNTWNLQERNKHWKGGTYLEPMNLERMLQEIDVAHRMGVDVFVLDTGWYEKTGDWEVSRQRFPDGLKTIKARLDSYGMKLGLWFGPTTAAVSSRIGGEHPEWRASWDGKQYAPTEVWGTEKSYAMCIVSEYSDALADELIRVARELGVTYFKWDDLPHRVCNDPRHFHGTTENSPEERFDSFRYQLIQRICRTADKITAAIPGAIIDFDVTEEGRAMGLAFLASGKYFLFNNGPYYFNYDVPIDKERDNWNLFFHQGQARPWIARLPSGFDHWIPSNLFLIHFFPDDPKQWQEVNLATLILGGNGIWGDLTSVSGDGITYIGKVLGRYKKVADDIAESDMLKRGNVSSSPEIYEKIAGNGRGAVVAFVTTPGHYEYLTRHFVAHEHWSNEGVTLTAESGGRVKLDLSFDKPGAKIVFFGVN